MRVKLLDIHVGERRRKAIGDVEDLARDLKENGQITPITIRPPTEEETEAGIDKPYVLVAGGRRMAAAMLCAWEEIEAYDRGEMTELKYRVLELHENLKRLDMTYQEVAEAKAEILALRRLENKDITMAEIASELGESTATFSRDVKAAEVLKERPHLRKASSRKTLLRAAEMEDHFHEQNRKLAAAQVQRQFSIDHADAVEWLDRLEPRSVDLFCTDPPYGIGYTKGGQKLGAGKTSLTEYDDTQEGVFDLMVEILPKMSRAIRETGWFAIFCGEDQYEFLKQTFSRLCAEHHDYRREGLNQCASIRNDISKPCWFYSTSNKGWIWHRPNSRNEPRFPERHAKNAYEHILIVNAGKGRLTKPCSNVLVYDSEYGTDRVHANQKPIGLIRELVSRFTMPGDTVVDCFAGSGAIAAGTVSTARYIKACEKNEAIIPMANGLLARHVVTIPDVARELSQDRYSANMEAVVRLSERDILETWEDEDK